LRDDLIDFEMRYWEGDDIKQRVDSKLSGIVVVVVVVVEVVVVVVPVDRRALRKASCTLEPKQAT